MWFCESEQELFKKKPHPFNQCFPLTAGALAQPRHFYYEVSSASEI